MSKQLPMPHFRRLVPVTIVPVLLLTSCAGLETQTATTTSEPSASTLALKDNNPLADTPDLAFNDDDPTITALRAVTKEDGICVVFDTFFDAVFSPNAPLQADNGNDLRFMEDPNFALNTANDGPFGQAWNAHVEDNEPMNDTIAENLNELSTKQCGYPIMDVFKAAVQRDCLTPIDETTGQPGKRNCQPLVDPRP